MLSSIVKSDTSSLDPLYVLPVTLTFNINTWSIISEKIWHNPLLPRTCCVLMGKSATFLLAQIFKA